MGALKLPEWQKLPISLTDLCINTTLRCGQTFRWRKDNRGVWSIALHNRILSLRQDEHHLYYRSIPPAQKTRVPLETPPTPPESKPPSLPEGEEGGGEEGEDSEERKEEVDDTLDLIRHYFNLQPNLPDLYQQWSTNDPNFARRAPAFTGIRILQQDSWECLIAFICSSNNNIVRISQMVHKLCLHYGPRIGHLEEEEEAEEEAEDAAAAATAAAEPYHDFPTPQALSVPGVEAVLRDLGFGYRAKYIATTARIVAGKENPHWLESLRNPESSLLGRPAISSSSSPPPPPPAILPEDFPPSGREGYRVAHAALLTLQGVGPKVADCVCLMGLGWGEAVPVDTHVWQIAQRDYKFGKGKHATLTKGTYDAIGAKFRSLWGREAGWAQSILFTANLKVFSERVGGGAKREVVVKEEGVVKDEGVVKVAVKEEVVVKQEHVEEVVVAGVTRTGRSIKREYVDDEESHVLEFREKSTRSKRKRRT